MPIQLSGVLVINIFHVHMDTEFEKLSFLLVVKRALFSDDAMGELVLRICVSDPNPSAVERFRRELAPMATSGPAGIGGYTSVRQPVQPIYAFWPALIPKTRVDPLLKVRTQTASAKPSLWPGSRQPSRSMSARVHPRNRCRRRRLSPWAPWERRERE